MLFKVFSRVCLLSLNKGQSRKKWEVDSIPEPQLQSSFKQFGNGSWICAHINGLTLCGAVWSI